jgi:hypothetical protein
LKYLLESAKLRSTLKSTKWTKKCKRNWLMTWPSLMNKSNRLSNSSSTTWTN